MNHAMYRKLFSEFNLNDEYNFSVFENNGGWDGFIDRNGKYYPDFDPNIIDPKYYMPDSKINYMLGKVPPMFGTDNWKKWDEYNTWFSPI
jgi:hypothetical protein